MREGLRDILISFDRGINLNDENEGENSMKERA
jgi:hypothetical protein